MTTALVPDPAVEPTTTARVAVGVGRVRRVGTVRRIGRISACAVDGRRAVVAVPSVAARAGRVRAPVVASARDHFGNRERSSDDARNDER